MGPQENARKQRRKPQSLWIIHSVYLFLMLFTSEFQLTTTSSQEQIVIDLLVAGVISKEWATIQGRCGNGTVAYDLSAGEVAPFHVRLLLLKEMPQDFSLMLVVKPPPPAYSNFSPFLFLNGWNTDSQLILSLIDEIQILHKSGNSEELLSYDISIADGNWHRFALSVKNESFTIIVDCEKFETRKLGVDKSNLKPAGTTQQQTNYSRYLGGIDMIKYAQNPNSAYHICSSFAPLCQNRPQKSPSPKGSSKNSIDLDKDKTQNDSVNQSDPNESGKKYECRLPESACPAESRIFARTCRDLSYRHPANGWYWIDPNLGSPNDAIRVYCNMNEERPETCIFPDEHHDNTSTQPLKENNQTCWYSEFHGKSKISYELSGIEQIKFLRLLSREAYQNFTYICQNSVAWYNSDDPTYGYNLSLRLLGDNEDVFSYNDIRPQILVDECMSRHGKAETIFLVRTRKLDQLPLVDFYPVDYGAPLQSFDFKIGPVCFN